MVFSWFAHTGLYVTHVGGKGKDRKRKNHVLESVFFRGLPIRARQSTRVGGKGGGRNRKNHVLESVVFSWFAHTGLYSTHAGGKGGGRNRKKHVLESVVFFVVCPYGPEKVPMSGGKKVWFFRGLPIWASIVPMSGAREEVENEKNHEENEQFQCSVL